MSDDAPGFFSRWSQRKTGKQPDAAAAAPQPVAPPTARGAVLPGGLTPAAGVLPAAPLRRTDGPDDAPATPPADAQPATATAPAAPLPTLADVAKLQADSDFSPFMSQGVPSAVKNAAMKKLFANPHFNVMDGLDTYIDDYSIPSPLSEQDLKKMVAAQFIKLVEEEQPPAAPSPVLPASASPPVPTDVPTAPVDASPAHATSSPVSAQASAVTRPDATDLAYAPAPNGAGIPDPLAGPQS